MEIKKKKLKCATFKTLNAQVSRKTFYI